MIFKVLRAGKGGRGRGKWGEITQLPSQCFRMKIKKKLGNAKNICYWGGGGGGTVNYLPIFAFHWRFLKPSPREKRGMSV